MTLCILDTDHLSLWQRRHPLVTLKILETAPSELTTTLITVEEQLRGRLNVIRQAKLPADMVIAYTRLGETLIWLRRFDNFLEFSQDASACYEELKFQKIRISSQDLKIAAIAISVQGTVVTRNQKDFEQVPSLAIVDWSV